MLVPHPKGGLPTRRPALCDPIHLFPLDGVVPKHKFKESSYRHLHRAFSYACQQRKNVCLILSKETRCGSHSHPCTRLACIVPLMDTNIV